jgi:FAD/FMN-containing dehydrogenase
MPLTSQEIIAGLTARLGADSVVAEPAAMERFLRELRKRFHQPAVAVARPATVEAVQALARWANDNRVPLVPQGGNTGLVGAQVPLTGTEVIVSLERLAAIREVDGVAGHMTVEAGLTLAQAHEAAERARALFPLWIASQGAARIGGVLSSNAGGVQVLAYGNARELCLGVEAVLADGRLYRGLSVLKKDNTGYDLKDLLVGAEGTLGIITAATLKLFPKPLGHETALCNVPSPDAALALFYQLRARFGPRLTAFELVPHLGLEFQLRHEMLDRDPTAGPSPWYALVEINLAAAGDAGSLRAALDIARGQARLTDAVLAESVADRTRVWAFREQMSPAQSREGASIKHDISVPIAAVPRLIAEGSAAVERRLAGIRPCPFGHLGDGNIHFNLSQPAGMDPKAFMALEGEMNEAIYEVVLRLGGSVSAEHGIGQMKTALLERVKDPVALAMMRAVKHALDPNGILNPGKVLR